MNVATEPGNEPIVIVGAGLAGLAAAVTLHRQGQAVVVIEGSDAVGGRVRSDRTSDGFILDRGFQVLFTGYPALQAIADRRALDYRRFDAGAHIAGPAPMPIAVDPFAHPTRLLAQLTNSPFTLGDDLRILRLKLELMGPARSRLHKAGERSAAAELADIGLSAGAIQRFFRPFFGGVFLDRSLGVRAPWFLFVFKMLSESSTVVPAAGIGALSNQLAARLPTASVTLNTRVTDLERDGSGRVVAVRAGERRWPAAAVVLAADIWSAQALLPELPNLAPLGCTTIYFASAAPLYRDRLVTINPDPNGFLNEVAPITNVSRVYAPPGQHLLTCTSLVGQDLEDQEIERRSRTELRQWFGAAAAGLRRVGIYRIPRAQFAQPPGWLDRRPATRSGTPGLYLAGEYTQSSSVNGALTSGVRAARAVMADQGKAAKGAPSL